MPLCRRVLGNGDRCGDLGDDDADPLSAKVFLASLAFSAVESCSDFRELSEQMWRLTGPIRPMNPSP